MHYCHDAVFGGHPRLTLFVGVYNASLCASPLFFSISISISISHHTYQASTLKHQKATMKSFILASAALLGTVSALVVPATIPAGSTSVATPGPSQTVTVVAESTPAVGPNGRVAAAAAYSCPKGQYLTYGIGSAPVPGVSLKKAQAYFNNWANDG